ncbi:MAG: endonuclease [Candidatus Eisenbacteria bacterium]|nr:endonuclease [Candidatus Eisenbacteria bacterium]
MRGIIRKLLGGVMRGLGLLAAVCILACSQSAETQTLSHDMLDFGDRTVGARDSLSFWIYNDDDTLKVTDINNYESVFSVSDTSFVVAPGDSQKVWVYFQTNQNLNYQDVLLVENTGGDQTYPLTLKAQADYSSPYYDSTQGLIDEELKTAIFNLVNGHTDLGYNLARDRMFDTIDNVNGTVECVYIGQVINAVNRTEAQNQGFNTEHTWPQSLGAEGTAKSDLNHLFPTDAIPNNVRANYPFGKVVNPTWQNGGSKLGTDSYGSVVFEPRDVHKGDVARAMFYFSIRYNNPYSFLNQQEAILRTWNKDEPVSQKEANRNNAIQGYQGKRNPFIDHPEFPDRIKSISTSSPTTYAPEISVSPTNLEFESTLPNDSLDLKITIVNSGNSALSISSISSDSGVFKIIGSVSSVPAFSYAQITVRFKPESPEETYSGTISIDSDDSDESHISVPVSGESGSLVFVREESSSSGFLKDFYVSQNYPNPFGKNSNWSSTTVSYSLPGHGFVSIKVFNGLGQEIRTIFEGAQSAGSHFAIVDGSDLAAGVYYLQVKAGNHSQIKKITFVK